jgi:ribosomal protein S18 acetylase RimI-like enzyme
MNPVSPSGIAIAVATRADASVLHTMLRALGAALQRANEVTSGADDIARYGFGDTPAFEALIARRGDEPVGFVLYFYEFSTWRGRRGVYVQDLYVSDDLRGSGLGRRLLAEVAARAAANDARYMRLSVHGGNDHGLGFYERLGFEAPNEQPLVLEGGAFAAIGRSAQL